MGRIGECRGADTGVKNYRGRDTKGQVEWLLKISVGRNTRRRNENEFWQKIERRKIKRNKFYDTLNTNLAITCLTRASGQEAMLFKWKMKLKKYDKVINMVFKRPY